MRLIRHKADPDVFSGLIAPLLADALFALPLGQLGQSYYSITLAEERADCSFLIEHEGAAIVAISCDTSGDVFGRFGMPAEVLIARAVPPDVLDRAVAEMVGELRRIQQVMRIKTANVLCPVPHRQPDLLTGQFLIAGYVPQAHIRATVDLALDMAVIEQQLRKGHRQQVRWGRNNLEIKIVDQGNPDRAAFDSFRQLHAEVVGHVTRGDDSWSVMFDGIASGQGRLILSTYEGQLAGGTLVLDTAGTAFYASGAYRRELFDKPMSHFPLFVACEHSKAEGLLRFDVGDVTPYPNLSAKERNIAYFKRGFSAKASSGFIWSWQAEAELASLA